MPPAIDARLITVRAIGAYIPGAAQAAGREDVAELDEAGQTAVQQLQEFATVADDHQYLLVISDLAQIVLTMLSLALHEPGRVGVEQWLDHRADHMAAAEAGARTVETAARIVRVYTPILDDEEPDEFAVLDLIDGAQRDELLVELGAFGATMLALAMHRDEDRMRAALAALT